MDLTAPFYPTGAFGPGIGLMVALGLGLGFGFTLERAGLGSARKLTAQFYHTDLTVFKVMFTAIITAMLGLFWLSRLGWLDRSLILLSPTYIVPQIVGGVLFGAGFVLGGYCPGTSCVAAASGKLDALALIGGMIVGVFAYGELYPAIRSFAEATPLGRLTLAEVFHLPVGVLTGVVVLIALAGFAAAERIERRYGGRLVGPS